MWEGMHRFPVLTPHGAWWPLVPIRLGHGGSFAPAPAVKCVAGSQTPRVQVSALLWSGCVTLDTFLNPSEPLIPS